MCGRFYFNIEKVSSILLEQAREQWSCLSFSQGEIYPQDHVLVLLWENKKLLVQSKQWGMKRNNHCIINARIESMNTLPIFQKAKPCAIVCNGFYEWKKGSFHKEKYAIGTDEILYFAGLYVGNEIVIITQESEATMRSIHQRMPVMMQEEMVLNYLKEKTIKTINATSLKIKNVGKQEQLQLF